MCCIKINNDENVEKEKIGSNNAEMEFSDDPKKYSKQLCHLAIGKAAEALSVPKNHIHKRNNNEYSGEKKNHIGWSGACASWLWSSYRLITSHNQLITWLIELVSHL